MKTWLRDTLASLLRTLPRFRGKTRAGLFLTPLLTNYKDEKECIIPVTMRDGSKMIIDLRSFEQKVFCTGEYDQANISKILALLSKCASSEFTILDIGANIGFYTIPLGRALKQNYKGCKLWAIEPVKTNFDRLVNMVEINDLVNIVYPVNIALGDREGKVAFHMTDEGRANTGNAMWVKEGANIVRKPNCEVEMLTLDMFAERHKIQSCEFIKVDIEGAELDFLKGGTQFINNHRPIILIEFNPDCAKEFGYSFSQFCDALEELNYKMFSTNAGQQVSRADYDGRLMNLFLLPKEKASSVL